VTNERQAAANRAIHEETVLFTKHGNTPFTKDDLIFAAWLREQNAYNDALLAMIRSGKVTCKLNSDEIGESRLLPGEKS
jgi:hypothetical protein